MEVDGASDRRGGRRELVVVESSAESDLRLRRAVEAAVGRIRREVEVDAEDPIEGRPLKDARGRGVGVDDVAEGRPLKDARGRGVTEVEDEEALVTRLLEEEPTDIRELIEGRELTAVPVVVEVEAVELVIEGLPPRAPSEGREIADAEGEEDAADVPDVVDVADADMDARGARVAELIPPMEGRGAAVELPPKEARGRGAVVVREELAPIDGFEVLLVTEEGSCVERRTVETEVFEFAEEGAGRLAVAVEVVVEVEAPVRTLILDTLEDEFRRDPGMAAEAEDVVDIEGRVTALGFTTEVFIFAIVEMGAGLIPVVGFEAILVFAVEDTAGFAPVITVV